MTAYYNEIDPYAAQWLKNLIQAGHIAPGDVDERSIADVKADDLKGYVQCHFFAGIGVWSHALRRAGWPDDSPVWTGSCPCQPFSAAGKQEGTADSRHLWPEWFRLIRERRPVAIFGEQVGAAIRHGWLDLVSADLEGLDYALGAAVVGAHSVGAPHIRQRLFFVADATTPGRQERQHRPNEGSRAADAREREFQPPRHSTASGVALGDTHDAGPQGRGVQPGERAGELAVGAAGTADNARGVEHAAGEQVGISRRTRQSRESFWSACDWLPCIDGKARPVEPGTFPLAHGATARVGRLRAYGNAIVAPVAEAFIRAYLDR